jgi:hypothetical protein
MRGSPFDIRVPPMRLVVPLSPVSVAMLMLILRIAVVCALARARRERTVRR